MTRPQSVLRRFLASGAAGGIVLLGASVLAMALANSAAAPAYLGALQLKLGPLSLLHWINDALMAIFFLLVGLEIKRELVDGHLASWADRMLPVIAATAGMVVPALVYLGVIGDSADLARGWAIPAATDIAFAIGILALLGPRAPASLKLLLMTIAIVDDMGAVAIIALVYTAALDWLALAVAGLVFLMLVGLNKGGETRLRIYLPFGTALWIAVFLSGVHPTIAGVLTALAIPIRTRAGPVHGETSPLHRLEHSLQPWVSFGVMPLFGLANAGVAVGGIGIAALLAPLPLAVAAGLFLGKQAGIFASIRLAVALGLANRPSGASWRQVYGMALLCGIGFTMSLFIGGLAFTDAARLDQVKIGVLCGSTLSAVAGFVLLMLPPRRRGALRPLRSKKGLARVLSLPLPQLLRRRDTARYEGDFVLGAALTGGWRVDSPLGALRFSRRRQQRHGCSAANALGVAELGHVLPEPPGCAAR